ncbi:MAG TPA: hypothetical protein VIK75_10890 [Calditerricola sp.]
MHRRWVGALVFAVAVVAVWGSLASAHLSVRDENTRTVHVHDAAKRSLERRVELLEKALARQLLVYRGGTALSGGGSRKTLTYGTNAVK